MTFVFFRRQISQGFEMTYLPKKTISRTGFYDAIKKIGVELSSYRKPPSGSRSRSGSGSGSVQASAPSAGRVASAKAEPAADWLKTAAPQYQAVQKVWDFLLTNVNHWQQLEMKFPGQSDPKFNVMRFAQDCPPDTFGPTVRIGDLTGLRELTRKGINLLINEAKKGDKRAIDHLERLHQYHKTIILPLQELLNYCREDLYELLSSRYTMTSETFKGWVIDLKSQRPLGDAFHLVAGLIEEAISLANIELVFWSQQASGLDRRTRFFKAINKEVNRAENRCGRLEWILSEYELNIRRK